MKRLIIFGLLLLVLPLIIVSMISFPLKFSMVAGVFLAIVGLYDLIQTKHAILRNFPILGHIRYMLELIRPEIQQYFIASNQSERPFNRETRALVYQRAKKARDTIAFGTQNDVRAPGYFSIRHSLKPTVLSHDESYIMVGGPQCTQPYYASRLNVSALSFGALSPNAIIALNKGAKMGNFAHNTGEGGLSPYHLQGGDIVFQLGTGLFGARTHDGRFCPEEFSKKAKLDVVKMIEIKLSQGAKPAHGGILPAIKVNQEVSTIRGIPMGKDCISPPMNPEFSTPEGLLQFVARLRELSGGKPVGFKLCVGIRSEFLSICKAMLKTGILPDFITVDGSEGGTGAAPLEFADHLGEPLFPALRFVRNALVGTNLKDKIRLICSGKVATGFDMIDKFCLGADMCNSARAMMFALGCLQSLQCNANTCPVGVATQNPRLAKGLVVSDKSVRVKNYHAATIASMLELAGAIGIHSLADLQPHHLFRQTGDFISKTYAELYEFLEPGALLSNTIPESFRRDWANATAEAF
ncbi:MAG: FMN-binding glutamate synthase family protein [Gammaproteobacteria bacterium]|nr:FMN-binding glutamate synthase family protein [Gammaproteobacteria bacterium]